MNEIYIDVHCIILSVRNSLCPIMWINNIIHKTRNT